MDRTEFRLRRLLGAAPAQPLAPPLRLPTPEGCALWPAGDRPPKRACPVARPQQSTDPGMGDIRIHPAADLFPMMEDEALQELTEDIQRHGLRQPLVFWSDALSRRKRSCSARTAPGGSSGSRSAELCTGESPATHGGEHQSLGQYVSNVTQACWTGSVPGVAPAMRVCKTPTLRGSGCRSIQGWEPRGWRCFLLSPCLSR